MKILFLINIQSGRKNKSRKYGNLIKSLSKNHELDTIFLSDIESMINSTRLIENKDLVLIAGGDGTVSYFSDKLSKTSTPFIIIPIGSGNDFAKSLNFTNKVRDVKSNIETFRVQSISSLLLNNQDRRLTIVCFGFEAKINRLANKLPKQLGKLKYTIATIISFFGKHYESLQIQSNIISETGDYSLAILSKTPSFGGGLKISNKANPFEDKMYLILVDKLPRLKLVYLFILLLFKKHFDRKEFREYEVDFLKVDAINGILRAQADGESISPGPIEIRLDPKSLRVVVQ